MPRALIIGGSVGGLFAANLLRSAGRDVVVFERASGDLGDRGTGIGTREELFGVMRRIGLPVDPSIGVHVRGRLALGRDGGVVHELPVPAITSAWARIWRPLRGILSGDLYRGGSALMSVEQDATGVGATFNDGTSAEGNILVAADGLHSTVRSLLLPEVKPAYAGYVAWRGVVEEAAVAVAERDMIFRHMIFGFPDGELMLSLPMPGPGSGGRRCHFVWFRPADEATLAALCTDTTGKRHGVAIPPPLIRPELIAALKADAIARLAPQLAALVHATAQIILQPIFDLASPQITLGRVALVGDAAFVARPHVATGVMKAALDAQALADSIASEAGVEAALGGYDRQRRPFGERLVARGRHIGASIMTCDESRIATVMREYGAAGIVDNQSITSR